MHVHDEGGFVVDSAATQILGVAILEFGVMLHRCVLLPSVFCVFSADVACSVLIGLTLAVDENFKVLFVVIIFHRTSTIPEHQTPSSTPPDASASLPTHQATHRSQKTSIVGMAEIASEETPSLTRRVLRPPPEKSHEPTPEHHAPERVQQLPVRPVDHLLVKQELVGQELHKHHKSSASLPLNPPPPPKREQAK